MDQFLKVQYLDEMKRRSVPSLDDENVLRATAVDCFPALQGKSFELVRVARHIVRVVCEKEREKEKVVQRKEAPSVAQVPQVPQVAQPAEVQNTSVAIPMDLISGALSGEELQAVVRKALATPEVQAVFARLVLETIVAKREDQAARARLREEKKRRKAECRARAQAEQEEARRVAEEKAREAAAAAAATAEAARAQREREEANTKEQEKEREKEKLKEQEMADRAFAMAEQDRVKAQSRAEGPQLPAADLEKAQAVQSLREMGFSDVAKINELYARHGNNLDLIVQSLIEQSQGPY